MERRRAVCFLGRLEWSSSYMGCFAIDGCGDHGASIKTGCDELRKAIVGGIKWENIPWRSSPLLFKRLKDEIVRLKDEGRVLMRFNELRDVLQMRLFGEIDGFTEAELQGVVGLLAGPGV